MIVLTVTAFWRRRRVRDVVFEPKRFRRRVVLYILSAAETDDVNAHPSFLMRMGVSSGTNASLVDLAALVGAVMLLVTPMVSLADGPGTLGARRACTRDAPT
ncbi:hypothetical protein A4H34_09645 [Peptidiphaga gingivicola]|uniref:Uncharacterized protein n=1 Tax=Peptidiphaga gingivicola TaxID=2741497 RepID=A0A179B0Y2_9ACTO|nr:hypothetical protein A4H34_09645 [Peptidiphaga gingivicola]